MKKLLCLLLALMMVLSLAACGEEDNKRRDDDNDDDDEKTSQHDREEEDEEETQDEEERETEDEDDQDDQENSSDAKPDMDPLQARFGASTADGYGIWTYYYGMSTDSRACIDYRGYKTFEMPASEDNVTGVYNDAVVTKDGDVTRLRSAKDGSVFFDSSEYADAAIVVPEHLGSLMFRDGYVLVVAKEESYDSVDYALGFMDAKGKWIVQLSGENPILQLCAEKVSMDFFEAGLKYCGEGILAFLGDDEVCYYYNIASGKLVELNLPEELDMDDVWEEIDCGILFRDGCTGPVYISSEGFFNFYTNGKVEAFSMTFYDDFKRGDVLCGYYYDVHAGVAYYLVEDSKGVYLCDSQGQLVKEIANVDLADCNGFSEEGTVQMIFENSEGTCYYVVMDVEGNFLFEPVKLDSNISAVYDPEGNEVEPDAHYGAGVFTVIGNDGKVRLTTGYVQDFEVKNGVACYDDGDTDYYVDVSK